MFQAKRLGVGGREGHEGCRQVSHLDGTHEGALCTAAEICGLVAYKIRILAKAMRSRASNFEFQEFQQIMATSSTACASSSSERRTLKLQQRQNPFVNFRDEDEEGEYMGEADKLVAKIFDGKQAVQIYGSGEKIVCDQYVHGDDGFIIAKWCHDKSQLELEVPNSLLDEYGQLILPKYDTSSTTSKAPKAKAKQGMQRPASAMDAEGKVETVHDSDE